MANDPNVALVQAMGTQGSAAKAPVNATAPPDISNQNAATATALARAAQVHAPEQFNATQAPVIANPYIRSNAILGAQNAGNAGVASAYANQEVPGTGNNAVDLQQEITRRAVQQQVAQHQTDVEKLNADQQSAQHQQWDTAAKAYDTASTLGLPVPDWAQKVLGSSNGGLVTGQPSNTPATPEVAIKDSGLAPDAYEAAVTSPAFSSSMKGATSVQAIADDARKSKRTFHEFVNNLKADLSAPSADGSYTPPANLNDVITAAIATYGPMFKGYKSPTTPAAATPATPTAQEVQQKAVWDAASPALKTLARVHGMYVDPATGQLIVAPTQ